MEFFIFAINCSNKLDICQSCELLTGNLILEAVRELFAKITDVF